MLSRTILSRSTVLAVRSSSSKNASLKRFMGGGGHGPAPPTFVRLPPPNKPMHEESELVWHDGVAPELTVDFDAPHISKLEGLATWAAGLTFFATLALFMRFVWDAPSKKPVARREVDVGDALGGYPNPRAPKAAKTE